MIKINLGCGWRNFGKDWIHIDGGDYSHLDSTDIFNLPYEDNSVDLIYDFNLGERAIIKNINFQGNKIFKDTKLRNIIKSEEGKFWKFITPDKYLDENKVKIDENLLRNFFVRYREYRFYPSCVL